MFRFIGFLLTVFVVCGFVPLTFSSFVVQDAYAADPVYKPTKNMQKPPKNPQAVEAATEQKRIINKIRNKFRQLSRSQEQVFKALALGILKCCALIGIALMGLQATLSRAGIEDILKQFLLWLIFTTLCFTFINRFPQFIEWIDQLVNSIQGRMAGKYTRPGMGPIDYSFQILFMGIEKISEQAWYMFGNIIIYSILTFAVAVLLVLMSARFLLAICEFWFVIAMAVILMGFGPVSYTKDYAIAPLRYCLSSFVKLLCMQFLISCGMVVMDEQYSLLSEGLILGNYCMLAICVLILFVLVNRVPQMAGDLISGVNTSSGIGFRAALGAVAGASAKVATGTLNTAQIANSTVAAAKMGAESAKASAMSGNSILGAAGQSALGKAAAAVGGGVAGMAVNATRAAVETMNDRRRASSSNVTKTAQAMHDVNTAISAYDKIKGKGSYAKDYGPSAVEAAVNAGNERAAQNAGNEKGNNTKPLKPTLGEKTLGFNPYLRGRGNNEILNAMLSGNNPFLRSPREDDTPPPKPPAGGGGNDNKPPKGDDN